MAANQDLPLEGNVFISVNDRDKKYVPTIARDLQGLGFSIVSTPGTARYLEATGIGDVQTVQKILSGKPNVLDMMHAKEVKLIINTPTGRGTHLDEAKIRKLSITINIPCITTIPAARAAVWGIRALKTRDFTVRALQDYFPR
jgi:carbamoyl-phosphate synthase large subunit